jgi:glycosyltransferase involved in cell wall biosynthesis
MNILIFSQYFWPENFRINDLAKSLKVRGNSVDVITGKPNYPEGKIYKGYRSWGIAREYWEGIFVLRLPLIPRRSSNSINLIFNYLSFIFSGIFLAPLALRKNKKYDVIFVYGVSPIFQVLPAIFIGWLKRLPVVLWVQDLWPESAESTGHIKSKIVLKIIQWLVKFCYLNVDLILVQSRGFIDPISRLAPNKKIFYFPNSVDKSFYSPSQKNLPKIKSLRSGFTVVFAGNIGIAQSVDTIIEAAEKLLPFTDIKIVIFGSGSKIEMLKKKIEIRGLKNIFLEGKYPIETMPLILRKASVLLVSLSNKPIFNLTIPNKIQAYFAVGRPIIASLNGEGALMIKEAAAGLISPAENSTSLANNIIKMYQMTDNERARFGRNGRLFFKKNFNEDILLDDLISHFKILIGKKNI